MLPRSDILVMRPLGYEFFTARRSVRGRLESPSRIPRNRATVRVYRVPSVAGWRLFQRGNDPTAIWHFLYGEGGVVLAASINV